MVTSAPRRRQTLPSSRPITPAPITPRRFGTLSKSSAPALSTMVLPSNFANGSSMDVEPGARITFVPEISLTLPSCALIATTRLGLSVAKPAKGVTLLPLNSMAMPPVNCLTILSLRPIIVFTSIAGFAALMP
jgi:hypothetical protein